MPVTRVRRRSPGAALAFAAALATAAHAAAQDAAPQPGPTFRTGVDLLSVDVTVVDEQGHPPRDLRPGDFAVTMDGQPRQVVTAEFVHLADPMAEQAPARAAISDSGAAVVSNTSQPRGRLIVFVVDQGNIRSGAARPVMASATRFLKRLTPGDRVALATIPPPGPVLDFTSDLDAVGRAMQRVAGTAMPSERRRFNLGLAEAISLQEGRDVLLRQQVLERECISAGATGSELERCERDLEMEAAEIVFERVQQTRQSLDALRDVLRGLQGNDAPKSLLFISEGLVLESAGGSDLEDIVRLAAAARVTINVIVLEVSRFDASQRVFPTSPVRDRELELRGLEMLAGMARGSLFNAVASIDPIFARIERETSGYYLLGVEPAAGDRDGRSRRLSVEVHRRGLRVRARRTFSAITAATRPRTAEERVAEALASPLLSTEVPVRVTTYVSQAGASGRVRVQVVAEIESDPQESAEYIVGLRIADRSGKVAAGGVEKRTLERAPGAPGGVRELNGALDIEPGSYTLKVAVMDGSGRRGSVEVPLAALQFGGETLTAGDLVVGNPDDQGNVRAAVEPRVQAGRLAGVFEVYAAAAATFERTKAWIEVADREDGPALAGAPARLAPGASETTRNAQAMVDLARLPPGRYVARARLELDGKPAGMLARPIVLLSGSTAAAAGRAPGGAAAMPSVPLTVPLPSFDRQALLARDVLGALLGAAEKRASAAARKAVAQARRGDLGPAALGALDAGDQVLAAFLRALDMYGKGQLDAAATQLRAALSAGPHPPAMLLLGACFAAAGRDAEAANYWQSAAAAGSELPIVHRLLADVRLRRGEAALAVAPLRLALEQAPGDPALERWLALAEAVSTPDAALPTLARYLDSHPRDEDVLLAAMQVIVNLHITGRAPDVPLATRDRFARYAAAYPVTGAQRPLVERWKAYMQQ